MKAIDKNGDSKISYEGVLDETCYTFLLHYILTMITDNQLAEFRTFVEGTESQLYTLFKQIDVDHNGQLDKEELKVAFKRAGLSVPPKELDHFFAKFDRDESGAITFDEWR
jgi:Ca2+-binding EF-hand superfamily protein